MSREQRVCDGWRCLVLCLFSMDCLNSEAYSSQTNGQRETQTDRGSKPWSDMELFEVAEARLTDHAKSNLAAISTSPSAAECDIKAPLLSMFSGLCFVHFWTCFCCLLVSYKASLSLSLSNSIEWIEAQAKWQTCWKLSCLCFPSLCLLMGAGKSRSSKCKVNIIGQRSLKGHSAVSLYRGYSSVFS